jgi:hypothetical protein
MASGIVILTDESSRTTEESVAAGRDNDTLGFTLLASRAGEALVAVLLTGEGTRQ